MDSLVKELKVDKMAYEQTLVRTVDIVDGNKLYNWNRSKKWTYGYHEFEDMVVISKTGQIGEVIELCGLNTIARATIGETRIGAGTKIDSMVHIGHNVKTGKNCIFVASSACAGNARLGNNVIVAGKSGISDHVTIGDNTVIMVNSVVIKDQPANSTLLGFPAKDARQEKKNQALLNKLEHWVEKIKKLEKKVFGPKSSK